MLWLGSLIRVQFFLHFSADRHHNVVVVFADEPLQLLLSEVELEAVALTDDSLNIAHAGFPDRIFRRDEILRDEPDALLGIRNNRREILPAVSVREVNA